MNDRTPTHRIARLIGSDVGTGLSRHLRLLEDVLASSGYASVGSSPNPARRGDRAFAAAAGAGIRWPRFDLQVFTQDLNARQLPFGRRNVLLPMQEWFDPRSIRLLQGFDTILCQSEHAAAIFRPLHHDVRSASFTSINRALPTPESARTRILHIAGRSPFKGTAQLARIWSRHPDWPTLTITHGPGILPVLDVPNIEQHAGHLPDDQLRRMQNEAWLHVQTSEAEGFGHCLFEAMSCGGAVVTVDAPPMHELFSAAAGEGLVVPYSQRIPLNLGYRFIADEEALEVELLRLISLGRDGTRPIGDAAQQRFRAHDQRARALYASIFQE